jgi:hypothetical protein
MSTSTCASGEITCGDNCCGNSYICIGDQCVETFDMVLIIPFIFSFFIVLIYFFIGVEGIERYCIIVIGFLLFLALLIIRILVEAGILICTTIQKEFITFLGGLGVADFLYEWVKHKNLGEEFQKGFIAWLVVIAILTIGFCIISWMIMLISYLIS